MFKYRDYQPGLARKGAEILRKHGILYLAMEMRVGKTHISLLAATLLPNVNRVLLVTKKMAIPSILHDYRRGEYPFALDVINYESVMKCADNPYDLVICDEAHSLGVYPKPSLRARQLKVIVGSTRLVLMSGTPTPESYSQIYHQLWVSSLSPFAQWNNFYSWVRAGFVRAYQVSIGSRMITNYSDADEAKIRLLTGKLFLTFTQRQAKFEVTTLRDEIVTVPMDPRTRALIDILTKHRYYRFKDGDEVVCDTAVKLQSKIHQASSGTIITENGSRVVDVSKVRYIRDHYHGQKIAIFYLYDAEGRALKEEFTNWTDDPHQFKSQGPTWFMSQFQSGSRGIDLSAAEVIVFFNIHFSSELYQQARQRGQEKNKPTATRLHWIFSDCGMEPMIYRRVIKKQSYTTRYFRKDYLSGEKTARL